MRALLTILKPWIAALWWGSLCCIGFLVVPMLFAYLPSKAIAGNMAAHLFSAQTWIAVVCGLLLMLQERSELKPGADEVPARALWPVVLSAMLLALLSEWGVAPHIVARDNLALWHSLGTLLYLLQWVCATLTLKRSWPRAARAA